MMAEATVFKIGYYLSEDLVALVGCWYGFPALKSVHRFSPIFGGRGRTDLKCCFLLNIQLWAWEK